MTYQVRIRLDAQKQLDKLAELIRRKVVTEIIGLQEEPRPRGVRKIIESNFWRIRVGRFRVVYSIDDEKRVVIIVRISRRTEKTYENLWN